MTRQRNDSHSTEFGLWLRGQTAIDSCYGFVATNVDYMWTNYQSGKWMLIEEKRHGRQPAMAQIKCFQVIDRACKADIKYAGFHVLVFENTSPKDGRIWLDGEEITKADLLSFLKFELPFRPMFSNED